LIVREGFRLGAWKLSELFDNLQKPVRESTMSSESSVEFSDTDVLSVGPFTGFGNFLQKEFRDWWKSWRLIVVFGVMTLLLTLMVFFGFTSFAKWQRNFIARMGGEVPSDELIATRFILQLFEHGPALVLQILIVIFSTMGLLTLEKSTGTLAWSLTKPVGRTGLLLAKWLAATAMLWLSMCVLPMSIGCVCMYAYHHITPDLAMIAPIVGVACAWIGLWVLLSLTISLGFQSQAAVAGIIITFWAVPDLFGVLMGEVIGEEAKKWVVDRLATNSPFWAYDLFADKKLFFFGHPDPQNIYYYAFAAWAVVLAALAVTIFNRQEIGS
jgi:ABC-type transport system involved in multi-copper enzyme maturation permease subunit